METSAERFFKGFSLEDYRLQVLVNRLEKEKKQCLNRLREETHVFKMSVRPPVKSGEECWSQYGEIFHANGDKRDTGSITHVNMDHNKEGGFLFVSLYCLFLSIKEFLSNISSSVVSA